MGKKHPNILLVLTDQERYQNDWPRGYELPGRRWLKERGVTFRNHHINSSYCTSSRSVLYTGQHMPVTGMFDNSTFPFVGSMSMKIPTLGTMLRQCGYYTAYKGKWHLAFENEPTDEEQAHAYVNALERYGFSDWNPAGDVMGHPLDGYWRDVETTAGAMGWMRQTGAKLNREDKPWFLAVNLVNPHDIMYFNTDKPGEDVQDTGKLLAHINRAPDTESYRKQWDFPVAKSYEQAIDAEGRPQAHKDFQDAMGYSMGFIPAEEERWKRFDSYYLNCIMESDRKLQMLYRELEELGIADDTVIIQTADHGEMAGSHGLRGKGGNFYREACHVPLTISVPGGPSGVECNALTSHVDLAPTILSYTGCKDSTIKRLMQPLPGRDLKEVLEDPTKADLHAVRDAMLFCYGSVLFFDGDFLAKMADLKQQGKSMEELVTMGLAPDLDNKRGFIRSIYDGRYKFSRYFAPTKHNEPRNLDDLKEQNDIELFDTFEDPEEMHNLAVKEKDNARLIEDLNSKLNALIAKEIGGADDGRYLPPRQQTSYAVQDLRTV